MAKKVLRIDDIEVATKTVRDRLSSRQKSARAAGDFEIVNEVQAKRRILKELLKEYSERFDENPSLFISMSSRMRAQNRYYIEDTARQVGFTEVYTGFDDDVGIHSDGQLKPEIIERILLSNSFLGIWGQDVAITTEAGARHSIPGVWMPLELGMALAGNKPFRLLLHRSTYPDFIDPVREKRQLWYENEDSFREELKRSLEQLYNDVVGSEGVEHIRL